MQVDSGIPLEIYRYHTVNVVFPSYQYIISSLAYETGSMYRQRYSSTSVWSICNIRLCVRTLIDEIVRKYLNSSFEGPLYPR